jgi:hypothetical protein
MRRLALVGIVAIAASCAAFAAKDDVPATDDGRSDGGAGDAASANRGDGSAAGDGAPILSDASAPKPFDCVMQTGNVVFCDDFEPTSEAGTQTFSTSCSLASSVVGVGLDNDGGHVLRSVAKLAGMSADCRATFSLHPSFASKTLVLSFDFKTTETAGLTYAAIGAFVLDNSTTVGIALRKGGDISTGPPLGALPSPNVKDDGTWRHAVVTMTPAGTDAGESYFTQATTIDGMPIDTTPTPMYAASLPILELAVALGVFFTGNDTTTLVVQIDNVLVTSQ